MNKKTTFLFICILVVISSVCFISCSSCSRRKTARESLRGRTDEICRGYSQIQTYDISNNYVYVYIDPKYIAASEKSETAAFSLRLCQQIRTAGIDSGYFDLFNDPIHIYLFDSANSELIKSFEVSKE